MSNIILFHGTGGSPDICWYPWLAAQLLEAGHTVVRPYYPELNKEPIETFLPKVLANHTFDAETILIGHSGGAPLLLSILENIDVVIAKAFLVAGYATPPNESDEPVLQEHYDWEKIHSHVLDITFLNSTNDPYGCDDTQGRALFHKLGGKLIIMNEGHFGSEWQDYPTFEFLKRLI